MKKLLLLLCVCFCISMSYAQNVILKGNVTDEEGSIQLPDAKVQVNDISVLTDSFGRFQIEVPKTSKYKLVVSYVGYETFEWVIADDGIDKDILVQLSKGNSILQTATITTGKFEKPLSQVTVSMDILKPQLIESVNTRHIDDVLQKVPGVNIIDGQANIRGGSGWSYGAGSRVLLLVDDVPALQADAGFPNWKDIPVENIEQVEVVKGASSALYGSAAMNGIINVRTGFAKSEPETKVSLQSAFYQSPKDASKKWWTNSTPYEATASISHKQKFEKLDVVGTLFYYNFSSYNKDWYDKFGRFTTSLRYRVTDKLSIGLNSNFNTGASQTFFYWKNDTSGAYIGTANAYSKSAKTRFNIDPYLNYFDKYGNKHKILTRLYSVTNDVSNNQQNKSRLYYSEYQFQRNIKNVVFTAGLVSTATKIEAQLYGDTAYNSLNLAAYAQSDIQLGKLNLSAGIRYERNTLHGPQIVKYSPTISDYVPNGGKLQESKPVLRLGANYQIAGATFLRASYGQGYRFPTVAEMFIATQAGGIPIIPNPTLTSESGWSTELGVKQGIKLGNFYGYADGALFWSEYKNMMEFQATTLPNLIGFQSQNVSNTVIKGYEISLAGSGKIGEVTPSLLIGYTYIDPRYKIFTKRDSTNNTAGFNILKYRFQHNFKFDAEAGYKSVSLGVAMLYNSYMAGVDRILNDFLPGVKKYRASHTSGFSTVDVRFSVKPTSKLKATIVWANIFNTEYSYRPGLLEAPRNISVRVEAKF